MTSEPVALTPTQKRVNAIWEAERRAYDVQRSLHAFTKELWGVVVPFPFKDTWVIGAISEHMQALFEGEIRRLGINVYGRSGKSTVASIMYNAWIWASHPSERFLYVASTEKLAQRDADFTRDLIKSPEYKAAFGSKFRLTDDAKGYFENDKLGSRLSIGARSQITGFGAQNKLFEDPNDANEVESVVERDAVNNRLDNFSTRSDDFSSDKLALIQQRVHPKDATGHVRELGLDFTWLIVPLEYDPKKFVDYGRRTFQPKIRDPRTEAGEIADPERFPPKAITELKISLGYRYQGQANQDPSTPEGMDIKRIWFKKEPFIDFESVVRIAFRADIGYSSSPDADWTWLSWKAQLTDGQTITLGQYFGKWEEEERNLEMAGYALKVKSAMSACFPNITWMLGIEEGVGPGYLLNRKCRDALLARGIPCETIASTENKVVRSTSYIAACAAGRHSLYVGNQFTGFRISDGINQWSTEFLNIVTQLKYENAPDGTPRWKNEHDDPLDVEADSHNELCGEPMNWNTYSPAI